VSKWAMNLLKIASGLLYMGVLIVQQLILCECGEFIGNNKFKDYISTSSNPSTPTFGHTECGLIFDFIDDNIPKRYSSKKELKSLAMKYGTKMGWDNEFLQVFLLEVDRLKSSGKMTDAKILVTASENMLKRDAEVK
jgi:hypothetical protein